MAGVASVRWSHDAEADSMKGADLPREDGPRIACLGCGGATTEAVHLRGSLMGRSSLGAGNEMRVP